MPSITENILIVVITVDALRNLGIYSEIIQWSPRSARWPPTYRKMKRGTVKLCD